MVLTKAERLEAGLNLMEQHDRPRDEYLRVLNFAAVYSVLDGVTLTIRRLESHLRSRGVTVKIVSAIPDDFDKEKLKVRADICCF